MKYDKIVAITKEKSRQKAQVAKKEIQTMLENGERITVEELSERTGFTRSFFYRNPEVRKVLDNARSKQQMPCNSMQVIRAIEAEDEIINLKIQITKLKMEYEKLKSLEQGLIEENEKLKQELKEANKVSIDK
ncbi:DUF6262 family protein [[Clostridium] scindens]|uniref:DUF6262 family protein n=1 Tax=Clostridium scindens (strain JCM 10418 / VPI 12708) TaxID=29347 RepID=UPI0039F56743